MSFYLSCTLLFDGFFWHSCVPVTIFTLFLKIYLIYSKSNLTLTLVGIDIDGKMKNFLRFPGFETYVPPEKEEDHIDEVLTEKEIQKLEKKEMKNKERQKKRKKKQKGKAEVREKENRKYLE